MCMNLIFIMTFSQYQHYLLHPEFLLDPFFVLPIHEHYFKISFQVTTLFIAYTIINFQFDRKLKSHILNSYRASPTSPHYPKKKIQTLHQLNNHISFCQNLQLNLFFCSLQSTFTINKFYSPKKLPHCVLQYQAKNISTSF